MRIRNMLAVAALMAVIGTGCSSPGKEAFSEAQQNLTQGNYEEALEGFQEAANEEVSVSQAWRGQGIALLRLNRYEEAVEAFDTALAQDGIGKSFSQDVTLYKATAQYRSGDYENALASCSAAIDLGEDAQCYLLQGKILLAQDDYENAKEAFRSAVSAEKAYSTYVQAYQAYEQKDMTADGEEFLQEALEELEGSSAEDSYQRGRIYYYMGDADGAKQELMDAVNEDYEEAELFLGRIYLDEEDVSNARGIYQNYIADAENPGQGYNGLALCAIAEGKYDEALEYITQGLEVAQTGEIQDLMFNEIIAYERKLDFQTALEKMENYIQLYPDDEEAAREYIFLQNR